MKLTTVISDSMMISSEELARELGRLFTTSESVRVCSAYVTAAAVQWLTGKIHHNNVSVLGRFCPSDFKTGASDLNALDVMVSAGFRLQMLSSLHAKIYEVDRRHIFTGSANFTRNGLSLGSTPNIEACVRLEANHLNLAFIDKIFNSAIVIDAKMISRMREIVDSMDVQVGLGNFYDWPDDFYQPPNELFVIDLPAARLGEFCDFYSMFPDCEFAKISAAFLSGHKQMAKEMLLGSRAVRWIKSCVAKSADPIGIRFGQITSSLHQALQDDPSPFRKDVKLYQANLYHYIQVLLSDIFEIYVPGEASQFIRFRRI